MALLRVVKCSEQVHAEICKVAGENQTYLADALDLIVFKGVTSPGRKSPQYEKGYDEAKRRYVVTYSCCVCGKSDEIDTDKAKKAVAEWMAKSWGHSECIKKAKS